MGQIPRAHKIDLLRSVSIVSIVSDIILPRCYDADAAAVDDVDHVGSVCVCVLHRRTRTQEKERIVISAEPFRAFYAHLNQYSILACFMWRGPPNMHTCIPIRHQSQSLTNGRSLTDTHN